MKSILFVCMGNICRSPAAEAIFNKLVADSGRGAEFEIESAGTIGYHAGERPDPRIRAAGQRRGYQFNSVARRVHVTDFDRFDFIITMDDENFANVTALNPGSRARLVRMCDYVEKFADQEVPDPYYGGDAGFEYVIDLLEDACANLLRKL